MLLQMQQLPADVLAPAKDRITYALRRAVEGELGLRYTDFSLATIRMADLERPGGRVT